MSDFDYSSANQPGDRFQTTCWTQVLAAKGSSEVSREALRELCDHYYEPVLTYLQKAGYDRDGAARDLAHGFFEDLLEGQRLEHLDREKGRFRSYLLGALKHFISRRRARDLAGKRGGSVEKVSLDETAAGERVEDSSAMPPDDWFDRQWAMAVLSRALGSLESEWGGEKNDIPFAEISPWLTGEAEHGDQLGLAERHDIPVNTLKSSIHRLRRKFRAAVKEEVGRTLENTSEVEEEMTALFSALGGK